VGVNVDGDQRVSRMASSPPLTEDQMQNFALAALSEDKPITGWFDKGNHLDVFFNARDDDKVRLLYKVDGLHAFAKKHFRNANEKEMALLMEFVLHGLSAYSMISKKVVEGKIEFKDLIGSMMNMTPDSAYGSEEEDFG
jgi:magnesium chelatase subunit I